MSENPAISDGAREANEDLLCHLYRMFFGRPFELCSCGDPEAGVRLIHELLKLYDQPGLIYDTVGGVLGNNAGVQQVVLSQLGAAELTECSTTLWSGYLTARGKWVLWATARLEASGVDWVSGLDQVGYPDHECTEACWTVPTRSGRKRR